MEKFKHIFKRYVLSSLVTFFAGFAIAVVPELDTVTLESLKDGSFVGVLFVGARLGIKMVFEAFLAWYASRNGGIV